MGEAFAVASSAVSVISLGIQTVQGILWYYGAWHYRGDDVLRMCASLDNLKGTLDVLLKAITPPAVFSKNVKENVEKSIDTFNGTLQKFGAELDKVKDTEPPKSGARSKFRRHVRRALYPFKEATLAKLQGGVCDARSNLSLALDVLKLEDMSGIRRQINTIVRWQEDRDTEKILQWLSPFNYWASQTDVSKRRQASTGQWLLADPVFLAWSEGSEQTLWCQGMPGVGKTVLVSAVIEFLEADLPLQDTGLAFIYCDYKQSPSQSLELFIGSIIRQLAQRASAFPQSVYNLYEKYCAKGIPASLVEHLELLQSLAKGFDEMYLVIDALDECIDRNGESIWSGLLTNVTTYIPNLRLLCTSRHISDMGGILRDSTRIEIRADDADIRTYILAQVKSRDRLLGFCSKDAALESEILEAVASKAVGMFLAAQLHVESLARKQNLKAIRKSLKELPKELDDIYEEAMKRIELQSADNRNLALRLLSWIVHAFRPLHLIEIQHAIAIDDLEPEDRLVSQDSLTPQDILVDVCAGIVRVDEQSGIVRLIHYTTQKYFEENGSDHFPRAHHDIGVRCMKYLSLDVFGEGYCPTDELYERRLEENPLLDYAVKNGMNHTCEGNEQDAQDAALGLLLDDAKLSSSSQVLLVGGYKYQTYSQAFPKKFNGAHFTAYLGVKDIMIKLLSENPKINPNAKDDDGRTPLSWAAARGHTAVVEALLATGKVEPDAKNSKGQTPLLQAAAGGHTAVVEALLATGKVKPDAKDSHGWMPLGWAATEEHTAVVEALLATGKVKLDVKDYGGRTPLSWAAARGHTAVVEALLATGKVEPDAKNSKGQTPLLQAAAGGHTAVVEALLATGKVEPDAKDSYRRTPLSRAAAGGHTAVVEALLATGKVEPDAKDHEGQTPLWRAAAEEHTAVVEALLATGKVKPDAEDYGGWTPLSWAAARGHTAVVEALLATGKVEPDAEDSYRRTPLLQAAAGGHTAVVEALLATGQVEPDAKDSYRRTPLSWAAAGGHTVVVEALLATGQVEPDAKDDGGWSPLWREAAWEHTAVVEAPLATGKVEPDAEDSKGQTPLLQAAAGGHTAVVEALLATGKVEPDAKNSKGQTPLSWAAVGGHTVVVEALLATGKVEPDAKDNYGQTPLSRAAARGHTAVVELLRRYERP